MKTSSKISAKTKNNEQKKAANTPKVQKPISKEIEIKENENGEIKWLSKPEAHDYPASLSYLRLIYKDEKAEEIITALKAAPMTSFKAKDIFRASSLSLLGVSNSHVKKNRKKIKNGIKLSPIILVRDTVNCKVIIADGYHRLCAVYSISEDLLIPCKIV